MLSRKILFSHWFIGNLVLKLKDTKRHEHTHTKKIAMELGGKRNTKPKKQSKKEKQNKSNFISKYFGYACIYVY